MTIRLLLIEDELTLGDLLCESLNDDGFSVSWFVRAALIQGKLYLIGDRGQQVPFDASLYDVAALDGRLKMSQIEWGHEVIPHLVNEGLPVVAVSGDAYLNKQMVDAGAKAGASKTGWWTCHTDSRTVDIRELLRRYARTG